MIFLRFPIWSMKAAPPSHLHPGWRDRGTSSERDRLAWLYRFVRFGRWAAGLQGILDCCTTGALKGVRGRTAPGYWTITPSQQTQPFLN